MEYINAKEELVLAQGVSFKIQDLIEFHKGTKAG
jgi:hypothetical protein